MAPGYIGRTPPENHLLFLKKLKNSCEELHRRHSPTAIMPRLAGLINHSQSEPDGLDRSTGAAAADAICAMTTAAS